jgi:hypothetical protein
LPTVILARVHERCQITDTHAAGVTYLVRVAQTHHDTATD